MNGFVPNNPNPLHVANFADRLGRQQDGKFGLVFQVVTAISLGVMTIKLLKDMSDDRTAGRSRGHRR
jgi:hypothetical protein